MIRILILFWFYIIQPVDLLSVLCANAPDIFPFNLDFLSFCQIVKKFWWGGGYSRLPMHSCHLVFISQEVFVADSDLGPVQPYFVTNSCCFFFSV